ncbi:MAG: YihY/virulence factor BrkB family protein [Actinomycetales bacterium]
MRTRPAWLPTPEVLIQRLPAWLRAWIMTFRAVWQRAQQQGSTLDAAGMAFFAALAVGPAAIVIGAFAGFVLTPQQITSAADSLTRLLPTSQSPIEPAVVALVQVSAQSSTQAISVTSVVGVGVALYAASRFLYGLRQAMQQAYAVTAARPGAMVRLTAIVGTVIGLVAAAGLLLLASIARLMVTSFGDSAGGFFDALVDNAALTWVIVALVVAAVVRLTLSRGTGVRMPVRLFSPAVLLATLWVVVVSAGVSFYASRSTTLGVAVAVFGAPIVFLLWLYLCFMGVLLAAHLHAHTLHERLTTTEAPSVGEPARRPGNQRRGKARDHSTNPG